MIYTAELSINRNGRCISVTDVDVCAENVSEAENKAKKRAREIERSLKRDQKRYDWFVCIDELYSEIDC